MVVVASRIEDRGQLTRQRLLHQTASELVERGGHAELTTVARSAGISPSVVSHHFGSRAGLVGAVVEAFFDELHVEILDLDLRSLGTWPVREHERIRRGVSFHFAHPLAPVIYGSLTRDADIARVEAMRIEQVIGQSARNIGAAQRAGELPSGVQPKLAAAGIFGATRQITVAALSGPRRPSQRAVIEQLWRLTAASVSIDPDSSP